MTECSFFGEQAALHHVGLAVRSIRALHPTCEVTPDEVEGVSMAFVRLHDVTVELLEPLGESSPIARSLANGEKLLHLCYEVPDLEAALAAGKASGFHRVRPPRSAPVYDNRRVVWVFSTEYGLFELLERNGSSAR